MNMFKACVPYILVILSFWTSVGFGVLLPSWVHRVKSCPEIDNINQWIEASIRLKCNHSLTTNIATKQSHVYHCLPSSFLNETVEFCGRSSPIAAGNCPVYNYEFSSNIAPTSYNCSRFISGCPDTFIFSKNAYRYPNCLNINKSKKCYKAEKNCTNTSDSATVLTRSKLLEIMWIIIPVVVILTVFLILFLILRARLKKKCSSRNNVPNNSHEEKEKMLDDNPNPEGFHEIDFRDTDNKEKLTGEKPKRSEDNISGQGNVENKSLQADFGDTDNKEKLTGEKPKISEDNKSGQGNVENKPLQAETMIVGGPNTTEAQEIGLGNVENNHEKTDFHPGNAYMDRLLTDSITVTNNILLEKLTEAMTDEEFTRIKILLKDDGNLNALNQISNQKELLDYLDRQYLIFHNMVFMQGVFFACGFKHLFDICVKYAENDQNGLIYFFEKKITRKDNSKVEFMIYCPIASYKKRDIELLREVIKRFTKANYDDILLCGVKEGSVVVIFMIRNSLIPNLRLLFTSVNQQLLLSLEHKIMKVTIEDEVVYTSDMGHENQHANPSCWHCSSEPKETTSFENKDFGDTAKKKTGCFEEIEKSEAKETEQGDVEYKTIQEGDDLGDTANKETVIVYEPQTSDDQEKGQGNLENIPMQGGRHQRPDNSFAVKFLPFDSHMHVDLSTLGSMLGREFGDLGNKENETVEELETSEAKETERGGDLDQLKKETVFVGERKTSEVQEKDQGNIENKAIERDKDFGDTAKKKIGCIEEIEKSEAKETEQGDVEYKTIQEGDDLGDAANKETVIVYEPQTSDDQEKGQGNLENIPMQGDLGNKENETVEELETSEAKETERGNVEYKPIEGGGDLDQLKKETVFVGERKTSEVQEKDQGNIENKAIERDKDFENTAKKEIGSIEKIEKSEAKETEQGDLEYRTIQEGDDLGDTANKETVIVYEPQTSDDQEKGQGNLENIPMQGEAVLQGGMYNNQVSAQDAIYCDLCFNPTRKFCNSCQISLCLDCVCKHKDEFKSLSHEIVRYLDKKIQLAFPKCQVHSGQRCEAHCRQCLTPVCIDCTAEYHKEHFVEELVKLVDRRKHEIKAELEEIEENVKPKVHAKKVEIEKIIENTREEIKSNRGNNIQFWQQTEFSIVDETKKELTEGFLHKYQTKITLGFLTTLQTVLRDLKIEVATPKCQEHPNEQWESSCKICHASLCRKSCTEFYKEKNTVKLTEFLEQMKQKVKTSHSKCLISDDGNQISQDKTDSERIEKEQEEIHRKCWQEAEVFEELDFLIQSLFDIILSDLESDHNDITKLISEVSRRVYQNKRILESEKYDEVHKFRTKSIFYKRVLKNIDAKLFVHYVTAAHLSTEINVFKATLEAVFLFNKTIS